MSVVISSAERNVGVPPPQCNCETIASKSFSPERMAASLSLKAATAVASSLWMSIVPERIGEPEAPRPYFSVASMAARFTSSRYEIPR